MLFYVDVDVDVDVDNQPLPPTDTSVKSTSRGLCCPSSPLESAPVRTRKELPAVIEREIFEYAISSYGDMCRLSWVSWEWNKHLTKILEVK